MKNAEKIKFVKEVTEETLKQMKVVDPDFNEEDFRCGVVATITALFPQEVRKALGCQII